MVLYNNTRHADEIFSKHSFPYTIYITSYYAKKQTPVLNVVLRYLLWSCAEDKLELYSLGIPELVGVYFLSDINQRNEMQKKLFTYFETLSSTEERVEFVKNISHLFGIDYNRIEDDRYLSLLNLSEINKLSKKGVDIQLHTHRHKISFEQNKKFENEIFENKNCLLSCVKNELEHFCYPSGIYDQSCEKNLKKIGITSATTCEPGFASYRSNYYYLPRFLDGENIPQIAFEAEVNGVSQIFRNIRQRIRKIRVKLPQKME